jgi:hypothetical protein
MRGDAGALSRWGLPAARACARQLAWLPVLMFHSPTFSRDAANTDLPSGPYTTLLLLLITPKHPACS